MPSDEQHKQQAIHNLEFLESFYSLNKFNDWSITVAFYAAVHIVEFAVYVQNNLEYCGYKVKISHSHSLPDAVAIQNKQLGLDLSKRSDHVLRKALIQENFPLIRDAYRILANESQTSRYINYQYTKTNTDLIIKPALNHIITWINDKHKTKFAVKLI